MKLPSRIRQITRAAIGLRDSEAITPDELHALGTSSDRPLILAVGMVRDGALDPRLPGEQRGTSLSRLASAVADVPKDRLIVTHCG